MSEFQSWGAWRVDLSRCPPGSIVLLRKPPDSSGRKATHDHWFVVVGPPSEYRNGDKLEAIAVSSSIRPDQLDPRLHFQMPFRERGGHPDTGFAKPCYACVNWTVEVPVLESDEVGVELEIHAHDEGRFLSEPFFRELIARRDAYKSQQRSRSTKPDQR